MKRLIVSGFLLASITTLFAGQRSIPTLEDPLLLSRAQRYKQNTSKGFEENKGQVTGNDANRVKFVLKEGNLSLFLLNDGIAYQFNKVHSPNGYKNDEKFTSIQEQELSKEIRTETYRMDVQLVGANSSSRITTEGKSKDHIQYYNHNALNVHNYSKVTYHDVYPNIDWVIYTKGEQIKYDFVVHPGGNPDQIKLKTKWVEKLNLNSDGSISLKNRLGEVTENNPVSFQGVKQIETQFNIENDLISFQVGTYNKNEILVIDPLVRFWGSFYGGPGNDQSNAVSIDSDGNLYIAGNTNSTTSIASGGHQNTYSGSYLDAFLVKFDPNGTRLWSTYYGGNSETNGNSCAVDASGNVYLAGRTGSSTNIGSGGHSNTFGGGLVDAFIVKFDPDGVRIWGSYYGSFGNDEGYSCAVDPSGNPYLAGRTSSGTAYNIASGGHQNTHGGGDDAFLVKFDPAGVRQWATYYGGASADQALACAVDMNSNVYLSGETASSANIDASGHQTTNGGGLRDAFLVKFDQNGVRQWGTYYGGTGKDYGQSIAIDNSLNVYLAGRTESTTNISSSGHQNTFGGTEDAFLVKFNSSGIRQWGTYYGGTSYDKGFDCAINSTGNIILVGETWSSSGISYQGYQNSGAGGVESFMAIFDGAGTRLSGSYFGGSGNDFGFSCAVNSSNAIFLTGRTTSANNIAENAHQLTNGGGEDAFLVKFDEYVCIPTSSNIMETICQGETFDFHGQNLTTAGIYSATILNAAGCDSTITLTLDLTITPAPTGTTAQSFCNYATVADLSVIGTESKWYIASTGGTVLASATALTNGTNYYASQTENGCESTDRFEVMATITETAAPTGNANQVFCNSATIADLNATGQALEWYDVQTGGSALAVETALTSGIYYASQTVDGCESADLLAVTVEINNPSAPAGSAAQTICGAGTLADLSVIGSGITWYDASTGGIVLPTSTTLTNGTTYYASQTVSTCESLNRLEVTANINAVPSAPAGDIAQEFCSGATIINLNATGSEINWYDGINTTPLNITTVLMNGATYFATQTLNGCESEDLLAVTVIINDPSAPTGDTQQSFCSPTILDDLVISGADVQWYMAPTGGTPLSGSLSLVNSIYYASQTINGCESSTRLAVEVIITILNNGVTQNGLDLIATQSGASYTWVDCNNGNQPITGATAQTYTATANGSYAVIVEQNGCSVTSNCVAITTVGLDNIQADIFRVYPNPASTLINVEMENASAVRLFNISGKLLKELSGASTYTIDVSDLTPGMYMIESAEGAKAKFIKE